MGRIFFFIILIFFCFSGCAHVISQENLGKVSREITFAELRRIPTSYRGKLVLLGGVIVKSVNREDGTLLEVYQTEMDRRGEPINLDISGGRFLALYDGFLDSEIYRKGRRITLVGIVQGENVGSLGEVEYRYPFLRIKESFLWREESPYEPYPWTLREPWWDYPWYPWYYPYWRNRRR